MTTYFSFRICLGKALLAVFLAGLMTGATAWSQSHGDHAGHHHGPGKIAPQVPSGRGPVARFGGQMTASARHVFEVVYQPRETRVYVYDSAQRPLSARAVRGEIVMQIRGNPQEFRYPLQYVATAAGQQDYVAARVDVSRVRDGDMTVHFFLASLPAPEEPGVRFVQTFALSRRALTITVAKITEGDRGAIARQGICPVTDEALGSMGAPIKVLIGDQAIYVCCEGCISKVRKNPEFYLKKARGSGQAQHGSVAPQIRVTQATASDRAAIRAQGLCPVTEEALGSMGTPIKISIDGQALYVCCKGCVRKVKKNPNVYLAKAAQLRR